MSNTAVSRELRFWNRLAKRYARRPVADEAAYQKKLSVTRTYLRPDMNVLEFGCGTGTTAIWHAPHVHHIRATDLSSKMIEIARRKAEAAGVSNVTFEQISIDDLSAPDSSYDAVLGLNILHLLEDMDGALAKVHRMLRPRGVFVTSTACLADGQSWFRYVAPLGRMLRLIPLVRIFSKEHLETSIKRAGFEIDYQWRPGEGRAVFIVARKMAN